MLKHSDFLLAAQVLAGSITDALKDEDEGYFPEVTVERDERSTRFGSDKVHRPPSHQTPVFTQMW